MSHQFNFSVLYIESEHFILRSICNMIDDRIKNLYLAQDGQEGLQTFKKKKPDIVITNIDIPKLDGFAMLDKILAISPVAKIIIISSFVDSEKVTKAVDIGISGFFTIPFHKEKLIDLLEKLENEIRDERELEQKKRQMYDNARIDPLTEYMNKQGMLELLNEEIESYKKSERVQKQVFSILIFEIKNWEKIKSGQGVKGANETLTSCSKNIWLKIRGQDTISRWGENAFLLLLPETDTMGAEILAKRLSKKSNTNKPQDHDKQIAIKPLIGVAEYYDELSTEELVKNAMLDLQKR